LRYPGELRRTQSIINPLIFNWRTDFLFPLFQTGGARNYWVPHDGIPSGYFIEGFLILQHLIFQAFASIKKSDSFKMEELPNVMLQKYPYPPFVLDVLLQGLQSLVSLFILLSFVYPCINIIKYVTTEKEKQLKEAMKIMGLDVSKEKKLSIFLINF
jgi:ATP-binding cassette subfamily A (ABC1) protein 3